MEDHQRRHWNFVYEEDPGKFGCAPSVAARLATKPFQERNAVRILELGCGPGRDATYFANLGLHVTAVDYAKTAVDLLNAKAADLGIADRLNALQCDLREPLPLEPAVFDACYSHMAMCMELRELQLVEIFTEVRRILKPGGLNFYTVRTTEDPDYRAGIHLGEDMFQVDDYAIHFFSLQKVARLAEGYRVIQIGRFEEGSKQLFNVTLQNA